jgi:hypothetical protein
MGLNWKRQNEKNKQFRDNQPADALSEGIDVYPSEKFESEEEEDLSEEEIQNLFDRGLTVGINFVKRITGKN